MSVVERWAWYPLRYRVPIAVVLALATGLAVNQCRQAKFSQSADAGLSATNPDVARLAEFQKTFGDSEILVVAVEARQLFTAEALGHVRDLAAKLAQLEGVNLVYSLADAQWAPPWDKGGGPRSFLGTSIPTDADALRQMREYACAQEDWVGALLSRDGTVAVIAVMQSHIGTDYYMRDRFVNQVKAIVAATPRPPSVDNVYITGVSPMVCEVVDYLKRDFLLFIGFSIAIFVLFLYATFRTLRGVVIPLVTIAVSATWTIGLFIAMGGTVDSMTIMLPTLIAVVCLSDVVHILGHYYELSTQRETREQVLHGLMVNMIPACFLTSITTAAGFGSLALTSLVQVRTFGLWTSFGIMLAYVLTMTLVPLLLSVLPLPHAALQQRWTHGWGTVVLGRSVRLTIRDRWVVPVVSTVLLIASVVGILRLEAGTELSKMLPESSSAVRGLRLVEAKLGGFSSMEVVIEGAKGDFEGLWAVTSLRQLQAALRQLPDVDRALSVVDLIQVGGEPFPEDDAELRDGLDAVGELRPKLSKAFLTADRSKARISLRVRSISSRRLLQLLQRVDECAAEALDGRLHAYTTGNSKIFAVQATQLVHSQVWSMAGSFATVSLMMILFLMSIRLGLLSLIPNILPVVMTLGLMGWAGIPLDFSTVMIACAAFGLAVDNTIHFLARYRREMAVDQDVDAAVCRTMGGLGQSMVTTGIVIGGAFCVFALSSFPPNRYFGVLMAFTMGTALLADLIVTPWLVAKSRLR